MNSHCRLLLLYMSTGWCIFAAEMKTEGLHRLFASVSQTDFLPANCDIYYLSDTIQVRFTCTDDTELGNFNIEIHNNFDHHTHSTEAEDCDEGEEHHHGEEEHHHNDVEEIWVFNQDYAIPAGLKEYTANIEIPVPEDVLDGDYHFMLRLTDRAGWQTIKAVAIKIIHNQ